MADNKIIREAYVKRIEELEKFENAASSEEECKRIARKRRYVENKLFRLSLAVEQRKDYKVKTYATSTQEVKHISLRSERLSECV